MHNRRRQEGTGRTNLAIENLVRMVELAINIRKTRRQNNSTTSARSAAPKRLPDARWHAHAYWRGDSANYRNKVSRRIPDRCADAPIARRSSHTRRIREFLAV
jgi:hypothetical protein